MKFFSGHHDHLRSLKKKKIKNRTNLDKFIPPKHVPKKNKIPIYSNFVITFAQDIHDHLSSFKKNRTRKSGLEKVITIKHLPKYENFIKNRIFIMKLLQYIQNYFKW